MPDNIINGKILLNKDENIILHPQTNSNQIVDLIPTINTTLTDKLKSYSLYSEVEDLLLNTKNDLLIKINNLNINFDKLKSELITTNQTITDLTTLNIDNRNLPIEDIACSLHYINQVQNEIEDIYNYISSCKKQINQFNETINSFTADNNLVIESIYSFKHTVEETENNVANLHSSFQSLQSFINNTNNEINFSIDQINANINHNKKLIDANLNNISNSDKNIAKLQSITDSHDDTLNSIQQKLNKITNSISNLTVHTDTNSYSFEELNKTLTKANNDIANIFSSITNLFAVSNDHTDQLNNLNQTVANNNVILTNNINQINDKLDIIQYDNIIDLSNNLSQTNANINLINSSINTQNSNITELQSTFTNKIKEINSDLTSLKNLIQENDYSTSVSLERENLIKNELYNNINDLNVKIIDINSLISSINTNVNDIKSNIIFHSTCINNINDSLTDISTEIDNIKAFKKQHDELIENINSISDYIDKINLQSNSFINSLAILKEKVDLLAVSRENELLNKFQNDINLINNDINSIGNNINDLYNSNENINTKINDIKKEIYTVNEHVSIINTNSMNLNNSFNELKNDLYTDINNLNNKTDTNTNSINSLSDSLSLKEETLQNQINLINNNLSETKDNIDKINIKNENNFDSININLNNVNEVNTRLETEMHTAFANIANINTEIVNLNNKLSSTAINLINTDLADINARINNIQTQIDDINSEKNVIYKTIEEVNNKSIKRKNEVLEKINNKIIIDTIEPLGVENGTVWFNPDDLSIQVYKNEWIKFTEKQIGPSQLQLAKDFMYALTTIKASDGIEGIEMLDLALQTISSYSKIQNLIDDLVNEAEHNRLSPASFLLQKCGVNLTNIDTGSILGSDAGGSISYNLEDIVKENTDINLIYPAGNMTIPGDIFPNGKYTMKYKYINGIHFLFPPEEELTEDRALVIKYLANWILPAALNTIEKAYNLTFTMASNTLSKVYMTNQENAYLYNAKMIPVFFDDSPYSPATLNDSTLASCISGFDTDTLQSNWTTIVINSKYYGKIQENNENGLSSTVNEYLDLTITHELIHALMKTNIYKFSGKTLMYTNEENNTVSLITQPFPIWFIEGSAELVIGIDNIRYSNILQIIEDPSRLKKALSTTNEFTNAEDPYSAGFIFLRYLFKRISDESF